MPRAPLRDGSATSVVERPDAAAGDARDWDGMALLPDGEFLMGSEDRLAYPDDGEGPVRRVRLSSFRMDVSAVTNAEFSRFVDDSGYVTEAERLGWSLVFVGLLTDEVRPQGGVGRAPWWRQVEGADWRHPEGPASSVDGREDHPVVHVTWNDALAFATSNGKRLPTEAEWEYAARGGREGDPYPWGMELEPGGSHRMNVWQGSFPRDNTVADGFYGTCPVDAFPPNGYGLHNMTGNTWEWCADWFSAEYHTRDRRTNPRGPQAGTHKAVRGGSYLSHASYCRRYRVSARTSLTPDTSSGDVGFRCAAS
jgi:formylglycine-generating enzyme required for sulfatase activity